MTLQGPCMPHKVRQNDINACIPAFSSPDEAEQGVPCLLHILDRWIESIPVSGVQTW